MKTAYDVILRPVITEKSMAGIADKKYVFEVATGSNKVEIRKAIEEIFKVKVLSVNTINVRGKQKRMGVHTGYTSKKKKAIVRLTEDFNPLGIFEGMF